MEFPKDRFRKQCKRFIKHELFYLKNLFILRQMEITTEKMFSIKKNQRDNATISIIFDNINNIYQLHREFFIKLTFAFKHDYAAIVKVFSAYADRFRMAYYKYALHHCKAMETLNSVYKKSITRLERRLLLQESLSGGSIELLLQTPWSEMLFLNVI